ncbi:MAG: hypothetical protein QOE90_570 [Thermoplasmata archaeon]|jgi:hypothetical protein|nr:hypothetical protein [Thermoplasmata archaeon]
MGRSPARGEGRKQRISVTPGPELLAWIMERTGEGKEFHSLTHAVERGWAILREIEEGKWVKADAKTKR